MFIKYWWDCLKSTALFLSCTILELVSTAFNSTNNRVGILTNKNNITVARVVCTKQCWSKSLCSHVFKNAKASLQCQEEHGGQPKWQVLVYVIMYNSNATKLAFHRSMEFGCKRVVCADIVLTYAMCSCLVWMVVCVAMAAGQTTCQVQCLNGGRPQAHLTSGKYSL